MQCVHETQPYGLRKLPYGLLKAGGEVVHATVYHLERVLFDGVCYHGVSVTFREIEGEHVKTVLRVKSHGTGEYSRFKAIQKANELYQNMVCSLVSRQRVSSDAYR